jgi:glycosyltransferase involved in cell wall biosynthesis
LKILCVIDSLCSGGAQRQLVELAIGFKEKEHDVSFLTYHNIPFFISILEKNEIFTTCIQESNYIRRLLKMRKFIRKGKYDAVVSFLEAPNFICEIAGLPYRNWKLVVGERSADPEILNRIKLKMYRWFHVFADYIVANSFANLQLVRSTNPLLRDKKLKVIYNTIDFVRWKPTIDFTFRKSLKLNLVIAARVSYKKNFIGLIEALSLLSESERSKIQVDWYGDRVTEPFIDGSIVEAFKKIKSNGLENVISVHPATHDITRIFQESDAVGLFSFYEGFPNAVCEGMACGKPVICSAVSDVPDILSNDMNLLFDPSEPDSIKQAFIYLINLSDIQLDQIGIRNAGIARKLFDKEAIVTMYLELLSQ